MWKRSGIYFFILYSANLYSQTDLTFGSEKIVPDNSSLHHNSYYISSDLLSIFNSVISKENIKVTIAGELCMDHLYGFILNTGIKKENFGDYNRSAFLFSPEFRWYKLDESCSALHLGAYCSFEEATVFIKKQGPVISKLKYKESIFEMGLSGGYKALINEHWVINPLVYVGISNRYRLFIFEALNNASSFGEAEMMVRIALQVGYRF